jgi:hypothetical protein
MKAVAPVLAGLAAPLLAAAALAAPSSSANAWLHVRVEEPSHRSRVNVNLPLPVVEAVLKAAPDAIGSAQHLHLDEDGFTLGGHHHMSVADMRRIWSEVKAAGDTELVSVEEEDGHVSVARKGDLVQVRVQHDNHNEEVHVDVPVTLVDALLSNEKGIDVRAAVSELKKLRGDIVRVRDKDSTVRIWIDESNASGGGR